MKYTNNLEELIKNADELMYSVKKKGKNQVIVVSI